MKVIILSLLTLSAAACTTTAQQVTASDGRPAFETSCGASNYCEAVAAEACHGGYKVVDQEHQGASVKGRGRFDNASSKVYMTYRCDAVAH